MDKKWFVVACVVILGIGGAVVSCMGADEQESEEMGTVEMAIDRAYDYFVGTTGDDELTREHVLREEG